jgi:hypothetical protein
LPFASVTAILAAVFCAGQGAFIQTTVTSVVPLTPDFNVVSVGIVRLEVNAIIPPKIAMTPTIDAKIIYGCLFLRLALIT